MTRPKSNLKNDFTSKRSISPKRIISFHNSISDIINKFENSKHVLNHVLQTDNALYTAKTPLNMSTNLSNSQKHLTNCFVNICSPSHAKQERKLKNHKWNGGVIKMVDSISDDVLDENHVQFDDDHSQHHVDHIQQNDSIEPNETYDGIEHIDESNVYEYVPLDDAVNLTPTKFMRLRNINIVRCQLNIVQRFVGILLSFPFFASVNGAGLSTLISAFFLPRFLCENLLYPIFRLILGTLYPAYASYKAVRNKDVKDYLKWIMYWIVFAFFTCCETFTDIFLSWFPFYYELKVVIVIWLLSPVTEGSSVLYRNFVHPMLTKREKEIDEYINQAKEKGCSAVLQLGSRGVNYATNVIMQTALKNNNLLRLTSGESSRPRDEIDYGFEEIDEMALHEEMQIDRHSERSSHSPFDNGGGHESDADYIAEEITESFDDSENAEDDEFDKIVTRGRAKRQTIKTTKANKEKKEKPKKSPATRQSRTTRAASVRF